MAAAVDRLPAHEPHVGRVVDEELEPGPQDELDLGQPRSVGGDGGVEAAEPVRQQALEDLAVQRLLGREVVQQAGPADADAGGDVVERRALVAGRREAGHGLVEDRLARRADVGLTRRLRRSTGRSSAMPDKLSADASLPTSR